MVFFAGWCVKPAARCTMKISRSTGSRRTSSVASRYISWSSVLTGIWVALKLSIRCLVMVRFRYLLLTYTVSGNNPTDLNPVYDDSTSKQCYMNMGPYILCLTIYLCLSIYVDHLRASVYERVLLISSWAIGTERAWHFTNHSDISLLGFVTIERHITARLYSWRE